MGRVAYGYFAIGLEAEDDLTRRMEGPDFLASGFVHIGVWGRRPRTSCAGRGPARRISRN
jgi:hypothetical protein